MDTNVMKIVSLRYTAPYLRMAALGSGLLMLASCNKDIPTGVDPFAYVYQSNDEEAADWKTIMISGPEFVSLPAPADPSSADYQAELEQVRSMSSSLSKEQREVLDFWGNNTMVRWMELAEEFTAKYFLPPPPGPNGDYPGPDIANPDAIPYYPFAHPPYAARMYAYLSGTMYDALISAWHYKYLHNRPAPHALSGDIASYYPVNDLPAYPSEDAALAAVAEEILITMFPLEAERILQMAEECRESRIWAGLAAPSDLVAGDSLGRAIARDCKIRASNDNMRLAQIGPGPFADMRAQAENTVINGQWPAWINIETPPRPVGITPRYGDVQLWWIPSVEAVRPGPPPAIGSPEYLRDEQELLDLTKNSTYEQDRIAFYWSDGPGTYSPPGHWNRIATISILESAFSPVRTARVFAYLNTAMQDAGVSCWDTKYYYFYPRPSQANPNIKALFGIPNFPSYTSGHSTFSGAGAEVLGYFFPERAGFFYDQAIEASDSRVFGRIHFRFDCEIGVEVGQTIGGYAIDAARTDAAE
jgi:hypothetical protein